MTVPISKLRKHAQAQRDDTRAPDERLQTVARETLRPLSRREVDRHIEHIALEVAAALLADGMARNPGSAPRPRWVTASDYVAKMRPFLVYN